MRKKSTGYWMRSRALKSRASAPTAARCISSFLDPRSTRDSSAHDSHGETRPRMTLFLPSLVGATGSGKTKLALLVAQHVELEILNADSRQIYRGFDRGTAKPTAQEQASCRHHLIDVADPEESYSAAHFGGE